MDPASKFFVADPTQPAPLYQQLYAYLRASIIRGELKRGDLEVDGCLGFGIHEVQLEPSHAGCGNAVEQFS